MTRNANALTNFGSTTDPADLEQLFGPPPAFTGEETKRHRQIFRAFVQVVKPRDTIEWMYLWDLSYYRTQIQRVQRVIAGLPKEAHKANRERRALAIVLDAESKKQWARTGVDAELEAEIKNLKCKGRMTFRSRRPSRTADDQGERGAAWVGQFGTTSAPGWPHCVHTMPSPSELIRVSSGRWPTFMIVL